MPDLEHVELLPEGWCCSSFSTAAVGPRVLYLAGLWPFPHVLLGPARKLRLGRVVSIRLSWTFSLNVYSDSVCRCAESRGKDPSHRNV